MKKITEISHMLLKDYICKGCIAVDFTVGTGCDTKFFASQDVKCVIGFDIQEEAIQQASDQLSLEELDKVSFYCCGHERCKEYISSFRVGIFNFGYLPGANTQVTTMLQTSKQAVEHALELLEVHGGLVLVMYPGHEEGLLEANYFDEYCSSLDAHYFACMKIRIENRKRAPYIWCIEKIRTVQSAL